MENAGFFHESIVQRRHLFMANRVNDAFKDRVLTRQFLLVIILGELDLNLAFFPRLRAHQLIFKAGDKASRTDLQGIVLPLAALERFAICEALEVKRHQIAFFHSGAFRRVNQLRLPFAHLVDVLCDLLIRDLFRLFFNLKTFIFAQLDLRLRRHDRLKNERFIFFHRDSLKFRIRRQLELFLIHGVIKGLRSQLLICFIQNGRQPDLALHNTARRLPPAKAMNIYLIRDTFDRRRDRLAPFLRGNLNR